MNIEHKTTPSEHWIVDGKAYRLATEADVGKECYFDDIGIKSALNDTLIAKLKKITEYSDFNFREENGVDWRFAYVQDDSLMTPQRVPVPALGEGWYLLTADDGELQVGDKITSSEITSGWTDKSIPTYVPIANWLSWSDTCYAARYFGPAKEPEPVAEIEPQPTKPIDWTKPVRTKDGRAVRVLCTDGPGVQPVIGIIDGDTGVNYWCIDGKFFSDGLNRRDLENVPPEPKRITIERWANIYDDDELYWSRSRSEAEKNANSSRNRLACVKVIIDCIEGEGLDVQP